MTGGALQQHRQECDKCTAESPCPEGLRILREAMAAKVVPVCPDECLTCERFAILGHEDVGGGFVRPITTCETCKANPLENESRRGNAGTVEQNI